MTKLCGFPFPLSLLPHLRLLLFKMMGKKHKRKGTLDSNVWGICGLEVSSPELQGRTLSL